MKSEERKKPRKKSFSDSINPRINVAIIGMGARFPQAKGVGEFWENLINEKSSITEAPAHRWNSAADAKALDDFGQPRKFWGGFINDADCFDAAFFKISPREAELMDPQQRVLLEVVWHTLEDARIKPSSVAGNKVGVFIGVSNTDYGELLRESGHSEVGIYGSTGTSSSILSNRISFFFDFRGPSFTVNTASSSSLVAAHLAVKAIQAGECDSALAGGANICSTPGRFLAYSSAGMLSKDGLCKTFDEQADGYVRGEGVGAVFLKPLREAISDGNYIYGVIKGSAVNHGGKTKGLTVTSPTQQCQLLVDAYLDAGAHPETVGYIEAHGSGTSLGDPIEFLGLKSGFEALCKEFGGTSGQTGYCGLGSVKTNIGHLEAAAGIAGLIKVLLAMKHATIPANLNFKKLNPLIALDRSPFYIPTASRIWEPITRDNRQFPRRAGVSSFGYGGAYAHVVIEEFNNPVPPATPNSTGAQLMVLSAPAAERLRVWAGSVLDYLESTDREKSISLTDLAYSLQVTREEFEERLAFVIADLAGLVEKLRSYLSGADDRGVCFRGRAQKRTTTAADDVTVDQYLKDRDLEQLAEVWVNGQAVDWNRLYDTRPASISLPLYPFASQRYWAPGASSSSDSADVADVGQAPQPEPQSRVAAHPEPVAVEAGKAEVAPEGRLDGGALFDKVQEALIRTISKLLKVGREDIRINAEFGELGFDSIGLREFGNHLNQAHQLKLSPTIFFEYPSVRSLAEYLVKEQATLLSERFSVGAPSKRIEAAPERSSGERIPEFPSLRQSAPTSAPPATQCREPIAIIGVSGCFPQAADVETLWENLKSGRDCITEIPKDRWDWQTLYGDPLIEPNKTNIKWGAFIAEIAEFDPLFFGISPREAELMDPQQRLLMTYAWKAIEDAGYSAQALSGSRTGIFIGAAASGYGELVAQADIPIEGYSSTGVTPSVGPNRVSYFLNLHGPSEPIETACSSSLVAIHRAVRAMQSGDCEMALAGGINIIITPAMHISFSKAGMLSEDGRCKTFSEDANGYVRGEGVGLLLLKKLSAAERDHDHIYALIRGSSENHGGRANSLTAPNPKAQAEVIKTAYMEAGIDPRTVGYIEAHGTGTPLGDPIEINGLKSAFKDLYSATGDSKVKAAHCGLGSVKTNIGHLELAAGVAGVIKVLLQLKHKTLVKSLHCDRINPYIELEGSPFYIVQESRPWEALRDEHGREAPRRAGVSSFSFGGANAHVIVEEYLPSATVAPSNIEVTNTRPAIIALSARSEEQLRERASRLLEAIEREDFSDGALLDLAYTLQVGREAMERRMAFTVTSIESLKEKLSQYCEGREEIEDFYRGEVKRSKDALSIFSLDEELQEAVSKWVERGKYGKLLDLWVKGLVIDWNQLYPERKPRRISLPTYPFARELYWIPVSDVIPAGRGASAARLLGEARASALHPLLQENTSDLDEQRFTSTFTGAEFFLADHVIAGEKVMPGVAYLEMARAAIEQASGIGAGPRRRPGDSKPILAQLKHIVWSRPIVVGDRPVSVHIGLFPEESGEIGYEVYTAAEGSEAGEEIVIHSQGRALLSERGAAPRIDLKSLRQRCGAEVLTADQCYAAFEKLGFNYGAGHRGLSKVQVGADEGGARFALARLTLPPSVAATRDQYVLHPSLLDGALQAGIGLGVNDGGAGPAMPYALDAVEIYGGCESDCYVVIRESVGGGEKTRKLDLELCDEQGVVSVRLRGLSSRSVGGGSETALLERRWQARELMSGEKAESGPERSFAQHWVLLDGRYARYLAEIEAQAPGIRVRALEVCGQGVAERFMSASEKAFVVAREILRDRASGEVLLQVVLSEERESAGLRRGLIGLLKSARRENPKVRAQVIEIEGVESAERLIEKLKGNAVEREDEEIRYEGGKRYVAEIRELTAKEEEGEGDGPVELPWREGGVYLITGGAGGLGLIFAKEIAERVKDGVVILAGRSELEAERKREMERLVSERGESGSRIEYVRMDVREEEEVRKTIREVMERHGHLEGILHGAGVLRDSFLLKKTEEEWKSVLSPKVRGLVNLDEATKEVRLDFVVAFSSAAAVFGNVGQGDYAAANGFMDGYAEYRERMVERGKRYGRTVLINWPLWESGGMRVEGAELERMKESFGIEPLSTKRGLEAFYRAMAAGRSQMIALAGQRRRLRANWIGRAKVEHEIEIQPATEEPTRSATGADVAGATAIAADVIEVRARQYFKKLLASSLKLPLERIEADAPFEKYGIDSILVMQVTTELEKRFGSLSKTLLFEYQDLESLSRYFVERHPQRLIEALGVEPSSPTTSQQRPEATASAPRGNGSMRPAARRSRYASTPRPTVAADREPYDVAIIGMSGRYPQAGNLDEYWENLKAGRDCITEIPRERWNYEEYYDEEKGRIGKSYSKWGGFIEGVDQFDPLFFSISPREAIGMDPQERLFLQCVYETLEDAAYTREALKEYQALGIEGNVGVFVGVMYEEYQLYGAQAQALGQPYALWGNPSSIANRVSYFCNFHGPSLAVDTMCSSSLTAIHLACQSLIHGGCELAIAGGVNVSVHPNKYLFLSQGQFVSSSGRCESFGEGGDGYVPGEGVGAVLLKPLRQAIADGDQIYGVIKGTGVNHGGKTNGYTVPNPNAQAQVIAHALKESKVDARTISYIEAHGTGTSLGDPIEIAGLSKAFQTYTADRQFCAIGSVKSNIGHCESAAGIAGVTKVLLQLKHRTLVPSLHAETLNPHIDFANSPFIVQRELGEWRRPILRMDGEEKEYPRIAGISSFGAGGANAHVVIEEYIAPPSDGHRAVTSVHPAIIALSARNEEQLKEHARRLLQAIESGGLSDADLPNIAYTLQVGREAMEQRLALSVTSLEELKEKLGRFLVGEEGIEDLYRGEVKRNKETVSIFGADEDLRKAVESWVEKGKYSKLLDLWVKGLVFEWTQLYRGSEFKPRRISLPTYPFARERYWISDTRKQPANLVIDRTADGPEPAPAPRPAEPPIVSSAIKKPSGISLSMLSSEPVPPEHEAIRSRPQLEWLASAVTMSQPDSVSQTQSTSLADRSVSLKSLEEELARSLADALYVERTKIDSDRPFVELGLDSIVGVEWIRAINKAYGLSIPATKVYDHPTIRQFAGQLLTELNAQGSPVSHLSPIPVEQHSHQDHGIPATPQAVAESRVKLPELTVETEDSPPEIAVVRLQSQSALAQYQSIPQTTAVAASREPAQGAEAIDRRIAIIGSSGRYPGANNLSEYWDRLVEGFDAVKEVPATRWDVNRYYDATIPSPGKIYCKWLGALDDIDCFDPLFFNISPAEAELMDPQHRLFLEEGYKAFEDAGYAPSRLDGINCGVYLGIMSNEYAQIVAQNGGSSATGNSFAIGAARIAYHLNLKGPAVPVDTACSSSLVAAHLAIQALVSGEIDMALVGGVTLYLIPESYVGMCGAGMLSPDGRCKSFDNSADGFVPGEGVGALVLKRMSDAERDGDGIQGVIIGSGINQDGKTNGLTAPSQRSQAELLKGIYSKYGIDPRSVSYVEAHGTGTKLGDPIELAALSEVFSEAAGDKQYCALGSVKSNLGHTSAAAGVAGTHKVLLSLRHGHLAPSLHFNEPNEHFDFKESAFYVNTELKEWKREGDAPRRAAVSSFGYSGTNAHLVIEEYQPISTTPASATVNVSWPILMVLSAKTGAQLRTYAEKIKAHVEKEASLDLRAVSYTLQIGREAMDHRLAFVADSREQVLRKLGEFIDHGAASDVFVDRVKKNKDGVSIFESDEDVSVLLQTWIRKKKLKKLAELWVKGLVIDWNQLYANGKLRRISLPAYPFARERYWAPVGAILGPGHNAAISASLGATRASALHPLLQENTSDLGEQRFTSTFTGAEFFLADHVIAGEKVMPGVAYLEMARAAIEQASGIGAGPRRRPGDSKPMLAQLKHIVWSRPIVVGDRPVSVHIGLFPEESGEIGYEVYTAAEGSEAGEEIVIHSQGRALLSERGAAPRIDLKSLRQRCGAEVSPAGPIGTDEGGARFALARLTLPPSVAATRDQYVLHPSLLDGALQAGIGLGVNDGGAGPAMPYALDAVEIYGGCESDCYVVIRESVGGGEKTRKLDLELCDEQGVVSVRLRGLSSRSVGGGSETALLERRWQAREAIPGEAKSSGPARRFAQHWLLLDARYARYLAEIEAQAPGIRVRALEMSGQSLAEQFMSASEQTFAVAQEILRERASGKVLLQVVLSGKGEAAGLRSGLSGLLRSARRENPKVIPQVIEIEEMENGAWLVEKLKANAGESEDLEIRYQGGKRHVAEIRELLAKEEAEGVDDGGELPWREGGVYLITGGAGGLGLIFAKEIAERVKGGRVILAGRSELDAERRRELERMESQRGETGSRIEYVRMDVSEEEEVRKTIREVMERHGHLEGILHGAGVLRDSFLLKKTEEEWKSVLSPKVRGLVNLDEATKEVRLDFVVVFSSAAAVFGNVGQGDYAAANGFMDGYAEYRERMVERGKRYGRTVSINWPLWESGGMRVEGAELERMKKSFGIEPLSTKRGLEAFYRAMAAGQSQVVVLERARQQQEGPAIYEPAAPSVVVESDLVEPELLKEKTLRRLKGLFSEVAKVGASKIEVDEPLESYGIDSIMITQLNQKLSEGFGELSKTLWFEYRTLDELAAYLSVDYRRECLNWTGLNGDGPSEERGGRAIGQGVWRNGEWPELRSLKEGKNGRREYVARGKGQGAQEPIAIIGVSGRYPEAAGLEEYWENLKAGKDCISEIPRGRWDLEGFYCEEMEEAITSGRSYSKWGGFIEGATEFDPLFFSISPREAMSMDPQERLFMQSCWEVLEDAAYTREGLASPHGGRVGVFAGITKTGFDLYGPELWQRGETTFPRTSFSSVANRVSYFLNLSGPSMPIDTMCSASLTAIHEACEHLLRDECELAIAGGVNLYLHPSSYVTLCGQRMLSRDGQCKSFGESGDGFVPGEGVGVILLKPLSRAIADQDHIYGVIKGTSINHGGKTNGYTVPNPTAQRELISAALKKAGINPRAVSYIEAHGTGTELGDPIEIAGLTQAFQEQTGEAQFCAIGSVKSNIGHLEAAAGIAGVTKVLLQLKHRTLVPSLHAETLNPHINFANSPFIVQRELGEWRRPILRMDGEEKEYPRIAGISSFGAGGANAHVVIEEYIAPPSDGHRAVTSVHPAIIALSARNEEQLREHARRLLQAIESGGLSDADLPNIAYTLQVGREAMEQRLALSVTSLEELKEKLGRFLVGEEGIEDLYRGEVKRNKETVSIFGADEDLRKAVESWVEKGKYSKLLDLWVKGLVFEWTQLYRGSEFKPRRISLPTYPFARERYWISDTRKQPANLVINRTADGPEPAPRPAEPPIVSSAIKKPSGISLSMLSSEPVLPEHRASQSRPQLEGPASVVTMSQPDSVWLQPGSVLQTQSTSLADRSVSLKSLEEELARSLADALYVERTKIDSDRPFVELGLDSIVGVEWIRTINKAYGLSIPATKVYDYPTIRQLAGQLLTELNAQGSPVSHLSPIPVEQHSHQDHGIPATPQAVAESRIKLPELTVETEDSPPEIAVVRLQSQSALAQYQSIPQTTAVAPPQEPPQGAEAIDRRIAIIGSSGRYPGANNLSEYWDRLVEGFDAVREVPATRWDVNRYYDPTIPSPDKIYCKWLGALDGIDCFDPLFFNISPAEAELMDPQHRLFLEEGYKAFEDAGYAPAGLDGINCGVYLGIMNNEYAQIVAQSGVGSATGNSFAIGAARIAYHLNLKGPAVPVDTACSSSLVAAHLAIQALVSGEIDMALVGGVTLYLIPDTYVRMCGAGMLSPEGRCKTFDNSADGFVPGEGVGALVLKRMSDAERDGDGIQGVIIGSGINQDGKTNGLTAPSQRSQAELLKGIYSKYGIDPRSVSYVEAHGTGTKLGDPIELAALSEVFSEAAGDKQYCALGSVKSNLGHTSAAAGVAGTHKVLLSLRHGHLAPSLHFNEPNEHFDFKESAFYVNTELKEWKREGDAPRRAAVSSFGYSGTNAHLVIEEYQPISTTPASTTVNVSWPILMVLSAKTGAQLRTYAEKIKAHVEKEASLDLRTVSYTLQIGREAMDHRLAFVADSREQVLRKLGEFIDHGAASDVFVDRVKKNKDGVLIFESDEDVSVLLQTWIRKKKLKKLAELWVKGLVIDWNQLYANGKLRRISLPAYPFARERYWAPVGAILGPGHNAAISASLGATRASALHPLLQENTSDLDEQRFTLTFTGAEFFLADHVIAGEKVMPGVAYLEMARAAIEQASGIGAGPRRRPGDSKPILAQLKHIVWSRPIVVGDRPVSVHIGLFPEESGEIGYEVYTAAEGSEAGEEIVIHSQGRALLSERGAAPRIDLKSLRQRCGAEVLTADQCYAAFEKLGFNYGAGHRGLSRVQVGADEGGARFALARLTLPPSVAATRDQYVLHPSLLDGALQAGISLGVNDGGAGLALPYALDAVEIYGGCESDCYVVIRESVGGGEKTRKLDLELCDEQGVVSVRLRGLSSRSVGGGSETALLERRWQARELMSGEKAESGPERSFAQHWVLLDGRYAQYQAEIEAEAPGIRVRALEVCGQGVAERFMSASEKAFVVAREILRDRASGEVLLQVVLSEERESAGLRRGLIGLLKSARRENPKVRAQVIEIEGVESAERLIEKLKGNAVEREDEEIRYEGGKRYVAEIRELTAKEEEGEGDGPVELPWREGGVYLITGGAGGLGLIFAKEIAERVKDGVVILAGRSELEAERKREMERLVSERGESGSRIEYVRMDVREEEEVRKTIREVMERHGHLEGILHGAGVLRDSFLLKKTEEEWKSVLSPKVRGLVNLDEATKEVRLDFVVAFSSAAAVFGNVGQGDYAAANGFMDGYAEYRKGMVERGKRYGRTVSINWPLWESGGMRVEGAELERMKESFGIEPLSTKRGLEAFYRAMAAGRSQMIALAGQRRRLQANWLTPAKMEHVVEVLPASEYSSPAATSVDGAGVRAIAADLIEVKARQYFKKLLASSLKLPLERIEVDAPFEKYGIDSILVMQVTADLEKSFGSLSKTLFFECQSIEALSRYFVETHPQRLIETLGIEMPGPGSSLRTQESAGGRNGVNGSTRSRAWRGRFVTAPSKSVSKPDHSPQAIAVIGLSGRYPQANDLDEYWENLKTGRDCITEIPPDRWDHHLYFDPQKGQPGKSYSKWGGFIEGVDLFDPLFFNISPREARMMDPQERLFLQCVYHTLEDAGYTRESLKTSHSPEAAGRVESNVGVFVGVMY